MKYRLSTNQKKILLLLQTGVLLGLSPNPKKYFKIIKSVQKEWNWIKDSNLNRTIKSLYNQKLIKESHNKDGSISLTLTKEGERKVVTFDPDNIKIEKPKKWDGYWRIIAYDIPENYRIARDSLRMQLKDAGFIELQQSVWVYPYDCFEQVEFLVGFHNVGKYTRLIVADFIDNEDYLKRKFNL